MKKKAAARGKGKTGRVPTLPEFWDIRRGLTAAALRKFIAAGGDVNVRGVTDNTPLMVAAEMRNYVAAKLLVDAGADVNARNHQSKTALHMAAGIGAADIVDLLLARGANAKLRNTYKETALHKIAEGGGWAKEPVQVRIVKRLLDAGCGVDDTGNAVRTPLWYAVAYGKVAVVRALLARGADPNRAMDALEDGPNAAVERILLKAGARPLRRSAPARSK